MPETVPDDLLPITEAAEKVGRPVETVRNWVREHRKRPDRGVQGYRRGAKQIYVSLREVQEYDRPKPIGLEENTQDSADVR